eukprot:scaffold22001_cov151-Skeletonema_dohrnii-CCMP3373.AAC.1
MTTISTRSTLSTSLARTKGGCATEAHHSKEHRRSQRLRRDDDDDDDDAGHGGVDEFEDEEIASVEADGVAEAPSDEGDDATKRELTAALVSSIVESAASSGGGKLGNNDNNNKTNNSNEKDEIDEATQQALGKRKSLTADEQLEVQKEAVVSKLPCEDDSSAQHVTPPASASSSFSSIEVADTSQVPSESAAIANEQTKQPTSPGRTMYQRASKAVATEKVSLTVAPPAPKPNPQLLAAASDQNTTQESSSTMPEKKKRRLDTDLKTTSNPIQPAQGTALVNGSSVAPAPGARGKTGYKQTKSPKTLTAQAKAAQGMVPLRPLAPIYAGGMKPVPNPLAGKEDTPARAAP